MLNFFLKCICQNLFFKKGKLPQWMKYHVAMFWNVAYLKLFLYYLLRLNSLEVGHSFRKKLHYTNYFLERNKIYLHGKNQILFKRNNEITNLFFVLKNKVLFKWKETNRWKNTSFFITCKLFFQSLLKHYTFSAWELRYFQLLS